MKVLLSAYACEPDKGSEQEVGWQRALHMRAFADEVWVITRSNNRELIETNALSHDPGLHFIYYDLPKWALRMKKQRWFLYAYFALWQWGAYRAAARNHREKHFDIVYHVTFASIRFGCFMGLLGIPLIIGPIAGGERAPIRLRRSMPIWGQISESVRDIGILYQRYSPLTCMAYAAAKHIFVTTEDSMRLVPSKFHGKTSVHLAIGTDGHAVPSEKRVGPNNSRFVFAGRLLHLKGIHLGVRALAEARRAAPAITLTLFGTGPAERWLRNLANECGVADAVEFAGNIPRRQLMDSLPGYRALVFPSLHDTGGLAVLEALSRGVPVVCFDLGGPGIVVNESCGIVVSTRGASEDEAVAGVAKAMISMATMAPEEWENLSAGAISRSNDLSWDNLTSQIVDCGVLETK